MAAEQPKRGTNWVAARDFWLALPPPRSCQVVADRFRVSRTRVNHVRNRDGWDAVAAEIDAKALEAVKRRVVRSRTERDEVFLDLFDRILDRAVEQVAKPDAEVRFSDIPHFGRHAQLVLGEATDRVGPGEVQDAMRVLMETTVPFVLKKDRAAWFDAMRKALGWSEDGA